MRRLLAVFLTLGYLAEVHCRIACASLIPRQETVAAEERPCHGAPAEPEKKNSRPCCMTAGGGEGLLPAPAPTLAAPTEITFILIAPQTGPEVLAPQLLGSKQNHDPPRIATSVPPPSSAGPRAPPAFL